MRKMARELKLGRESLRKLFRSDLGLKLRDRRIEHHLTPAIRENGEKDAGAFYGDSHRFRMTKFSSLKRNYSR